MLLLRCCLSALSGDLLLGFSPPVASSRVVQEAVAAHREVVAADYAHRSLEWTTPQLLLLQLLVGVVERSIGGSAQGIDCLHRELQQLRLDICPSSCCHSLLSRVTRAAADGCLLLSRVSRPATPTSAASSSYAVVMANAGWLDLFPMDASTALAGQYVPREEFEREWRQRRPELVRLLSCCESRHRRVQQAVWSEVRGHRLLDLQSSCELSVFCPEERRELLLLRCRDMTLSSRIEQALLFSQLQASRSERLKQRLVATVAHELRTPLTAIIGFADLAQQRCQQQLPGQAGGGVGEDGELLSMLQDIRSAGGHLLQVATNLMDLSRFELQTEKLQLLDIVQTVRDAVCWCAAAAEKKTVSLHLQSPMQDTEPHSVVLNDDQPDAAEPAAAEMQHQRPHGHRRPFDLCTAPAICSVFVATAQEAERESQTLSPRDRERRRRGSAAGQRHPSSSHRPLQLLGDAVALKRLFVNLIDNVRRAAADSAG